MSSGHTGRSGRGNRRARRGSQRPRGAEGQNGQPHANSAMLILSSGDRQTPAHAAHNVSPNDENAVVEEEIQSTAEEMSTDDVDHSSASAGELEAGEETAAPERGVPHDTPPEREQTHPGTHRPTFVVADGRRPHERAQPYAPGMRSHTHPPIARGAAQERSGTVERNAGGLGEEIVTDHEGTPPVAWQGHGDSRETPALSGRSMRAEHDDRGDHPPLRPEVRGEVGPLIDALHGLFEQDRAIASQGGTTRCGICYLHYALADLEYREAEGYYVCHACARALGTARLPMVRRQQRA